MSYMQVSVPGFPVANRREARKLGLLRSKSSEAEHERMEAAGAYERVCGESPAPILAPMKKAGSYKEVR